MQNLGPALHLFIYKKTEQIMKKIANKLVAFALLFVALGFTACEKKLIEGEPVLTASTNLILANGEESMTMKVTVNGEDVTEDARFFINDLLHNGNTFATSKSGNYAFYAEYNNQRTNIIVVKAVSTSLYGELPADSNPEQFSDFAHKVLLTQGTGTWCGYCPYMIRAIELFREGQSNADNVVVVAAHSGDNLSSKASEAVIKQCRISNFPTSAFNLNYESQVSNNIPETNASNINAKAKMELKREACVGIAAVSKTAGNKMSVRAAIKVGVRGAYRINAWLIEDDVIDVQQNYTSLYEGKASVIIEHDFVLRDASITTPIFGEWLGGKEECQAGETFEFYHEFDGKTAGVANKANCKVVVLVSTALDGSTRFAVNNVIEIPVGGKATFAYN